MASRSRTTSRLTTALASSSTSSWRATVTAAESSIASGAGLLCEFAGALSGHLRPPDTVARLGGDEFGVLLQVAGDATTAAKSAVARIETLLAAPYQVEGLPLSVEASIGIARFPQDGS